MIESTGRIYADLEEFADKTDILGENETLLVAGNIMTADDGGEIVAVARHRTIAWYWWLIGALVVAVAGLVVLARRIARQDAARFKAPE